MHLHWLVVKHFLVHNDLTPHGHLALLYMENIWWRLHTGTNGFKNLI
jgi:hypothetical protein